MVPQILLIYKYFLNYQKQIDYKEQQVKDSIIRIGGIKNPEINNIIPRATVAKAKMIKNFSKKINNFHIIIGTTSGKALLTEKHVNKFKSNVLILDIGKGMFKKEALKSALSKNISLYRLDVTPAYNAYLENITTTQKIHNFKLKKSQNYGKLKLVKRGILSNANSIIVDNVNLPKKIYGISDG